MEKYSPYINEFGATAPQPQEPKPNWFEIHVEKEKQFLKALRDINAKMNLIIRTMGEVEERLMKKMEYLEHTIDSLNE